MLVCFDIDGTLAVPRVTPDFETWERSIAEDPPRPLPGAFLGVCRLVEALPPRADVYLLTGRSVKLKKLTEHWVRWHFPDLRYRPISMRPLDCTRGPAESKLVRLELIRARCPGPMTLVDDDERMRAGLLEGDTFFLAPGCWR